MADSGSTHAAAGSSAARSRRRIVGTGNLLVLVATVLAALWGLWWLYDRLTNVYVLDARISSDMLLLSSQVSGWIVEVPVQASQRVHEGDVLVRIDDRLARGRVGELEAALAVLDAQMRTTEARIELVDRRTRSHLDAARSRLDAAESELAAVEGNLEVADSEWQRAQTLRQRDLLSQQEFEAIRNVWRNAVESARQRRAEVATGRAAVAEAEAERAEVAVLRSELAALRERRVQSLRQLDQARTQLEYHTLTSPIDGVIDELFVDPGEHVAASQRVLVMHDPARVWVKANVKETDLRHLEVGDPVRVLVDAYPGDAHRGVVRSIGAAATSQFALLPNPNPSGNFTKITQRVEVNIDLEAHDPRLRPGMMVEVKIPRS